MSIFKGLGWLFRSLWRLLNFTRLMLVNLLFLLVVLVIVFSGLIIFDTQRMVQGGIQEPVLLVVGLYLDIINLFMALLEIFGGTSRN